MAENYYKKSKDYNVMKGIYILSRYLDIISQAP